MKGSSSLVLAFATGALLSFPIFAFQAAKVPDRPGSLRWHAAKAKAEGKKKCVLPGPQGLYAQVKSLDEALSAYNAVIATPVASKTSAEESRIGTTYKLRVIERISRLPVKEEGQPVPVPDEFQPLGEDEFILHLPGGTAIVDGVALTMSSAIGDLIPSHKYLMFLLFDPQGRVATLQVGEKGVFEVKDGRLTALAPADSALRRDVEILRSLTRFRAQVAVRAPQRQKQPFNLW